MPYMLVNEVVRFKLERVDDDTYTIAVERNETVRSIGRITRIVAGTSCVYLAEDTIEGSRPCISLGAAYAFITGLYIDDAM